MFIIESETNSVLKQNNPCTAYEVAVALEGSNALERSVAIDTSLEDLVRYGKTEDPWKDLVAVLRQAQGATKSLTTKLTCWKDAQQWLETHAGVSLRKHNEDSAIATAAQSLKNLRILVGRNADKAMRKFRLKNFKIRMNEHRQNQEIVHHRSIGEELEKLEASEEEAYQETISVREDARLPVAVKAAEERMIAEERDEEARRIAASLLRPLTEEQQEVVRKSMYGIGPGSDNMAQVENDIVVRDSMQRLRPGQWLNDEVIHYFLIMLAKRDEALSKLDSSRLRCHFFKSFFMTKILNEGHANADIEGTYEYRNVKRWSKKVPGKDIFKLDKIIFPINQSNAHWICGVVFMQEKRIQMYDSLGGSGRLYIDALFKYIQDEHQDKKKVPLPDIDEWKLVTTERACPSQRNGFDCGVFTCMFADFLSNDCPLLFSQEHITQCRERIALSIMSGSALM